MPLADFCLRFQSHYRAVCYHNIFLAKTSDRAGYCICQSWCVGFPNVCTTTDYDYTPEESNDDYGDCVYNRYLSASVELADEILAAARISGAYANEVIRGPATSSYMDQ